MISRALVIGILCAASAVYAQPASGIGVVVTGDPTLQPQMENEISDWLQQRGQPLAAAPLSPDALTAMLDCFVIEDLACTNKVFGEQATSRDLVFAKVEIVDNAGARDVTITAYWFTRGSEPMAVRRVCKACTDSRATLDDVMTSLIGKDRAAQGTFELATTPAGARVSIDGKDVGKTPLSVPLGQGPHDVVVRHGGYATKTAQVIVSAGKPSTLEIVLAEERTGSALPFLVGAAGAAMLGTGVVLYFTSEEDTGEKLMYRDTKPAGIALSAVGAVTIGVATWLYFRGNARSDAPPSAPAVSLAPDGATLGWARAF